MDQVIAFKINNYYGNSKPRVQNRFVTSTTIWQISFSTKLISLSNTIVIKRMWKFIFVFNWVNDFLQNKTTDEPSKPIITRTIGMNPPIIFNRTATSPVESRAHASSPGHSNAFVSPAQSRPHGNNTGSDSSDDSASIRMWRNRSIFPHLQPPPMANRGTMHGPTPTRGTRGTRGTHMRGTMRPPMRPHTRPPPRPPYNQRLVTFKSPTVCIPDFISPAG